MNKTVTHALLATRIVGILFVAFIMYFVLFYVVGINQEGMALQNFTESYIYLYFPIISMLGLSIAWKWEGIGGIICILGNITLLLIRPDLISRYYLMIPLILGLVFLIIAWRRGTLFTLK